MKKKCLISVAPLLAIVGFALAPSAATAGAGEPCNKFVLCPSTNNEEKLRDDVNEGPTGGGFGADALVVNTQRPLRLCREFTAGTGCTGPSNKNPVNDAFFGIKTYENRPAPVTTREREECKEAAGHETAAIGWVQWGDPQDSTSTGTSANPMYVGTSPGDNGPWTIRLRSDLCTVNPGLVTISKVAVYFPVIGWWVTTPSTGEIVGKYIQPSTTANPTECKGGGVELNIEQSLEVNDVLLARTFDNGTTGVAQADKAIFCTVSANNYLYPTTAPSWGPFTGAIWKD